MCQQQVCAHQCPLPFLPSAAQGPHGHKGVPPGISQSTKQASLRWEEPRGASHPQLSQQFHSWAYIQQNCEHPCTKRHTEMRMLTSIAPGNNSHAHQQHNGSLSVVQAHNRALTNEECELVKAGNTDNPPQLGDEPKPNVRGYLLPDPTDRMFREAQRIYIRSQNRGSPWRGAPWLGGGTGGFRGAGNGLNLDRA